MRGALLAALARVAASSAAAVGVQGAPITRLDDLSQPDVLALLSHWDLDVLRPSFEEYTVNGAALVAMEDEDFDPALFPTVFPGHVRRLKQLVQVAKEEGVQFVRPTSGAEKRRLSDEQQPSGIQIKRDYASVQFGVDSDSSVSRIGDRTLQLQHHVQVTGDLYVNGVDILAELQRLNSTIGSGVYYSSSGSASLSGQTCAEVYCPGDCVDGILGFSCTYFSEENFQVELKPNRTLLEINPGEDPNNACPGELVAVETDIGWVCHRGDIDYASSVSAVFQLVHDVNSIQIDMSYWQYASADGFEPTASIDENYMEGVSITVNRAGSSGREHVFSAAVGLYMSTSSSNNCPPPNCQYSSANQGYCDGDAAPSFVGAAFSCDTGNTGSTWDYVWYDTREMTATFAVSELGLQAGDEIEVRIMSDQESANEDTGLAYLQLDMQQGNVYPFVDTQGFVVDRSVPGTTVLQIDPENTRHCPGELAFQDMSYSAVCYRNQAAAGQASATYELKQDVSTIYIDLEYYQYASADGFITYDSSTSIDDNYLEGLSITVTRAGTVVREHVFSASIGLYDSTSSSNNCPAENCGYSAQGYCDGSAPADFVGDAFYCATGNVGGTTWDYVWYDDKMTTSYLASELDLKAGDVIEVRLIANQESSNEDIGLSWLELKMTDEVVYPHTNADGFLVDRSTEGVTVVTVDPNNERHCPGEWAFEVMSESAVCHRNQDAAGQVSAFYALEQDVSSIVIDVEYYQYASADGFITYDSSTTVDDNYMEGLSITVTRDGSTIREHLFSAVVGLYSGAGSSNGCPEEQCGYSQAYCTGSAPPDFVGDAFYCDSGNPSSDTWDYQWYSSKMSTTFTVSEMDLEAGDEIEIRLISNQESSNEDIGVSFLQLEMSTEDVYPFINSEGWVVDRSTPGTTVLEVDPDSQRHCPGEWAFEETSGGAVCHRDIDEAGQMVASYQLKQSVSSVYLDVGYFQFGSPDGFHTDDSIDDNYLEGFSFTITRDGSSEREHIFSAGLGLLAGESSTNNCPSNGGDEPPDFVGTDYYCGSGILSGSDWSAQWYDQELSTTWESSWDGTIYEAGDVLEIRLICDQESENEDIGLHYLRLEFVE